MKAARTLALLAAAHAGSACSVAKINGAVDGDAVPAFQTGMVYEANQITDDDDVVAVAAFYTFSNGCDLVAEQMDVKADGIRGLSDGNDIEKLIDDVKSFEDENFPEDYWAAYVLLAGENESDIEDDFDVEDDTTGVLVCHHTGGVNAPRDEPQAALLPDYGAPFFKDSNRDCFEANEGEVRVSVYDRKSISLVAEVELKDADDDDAGEVELSGVGARCEATENSVDGLLEEAADLEESEESAPAPSPGNSCQFAFDGECDEPQFCEFGTDTADCGG